VKVRGVVSEARPVKVAWQGDVGFSVMPFNVDWAEMDFYPEKQAEWVRNSRDEGRCPTAPSFWHGSALILDGYEGFDVDREIGRAHV